MFGKPVIDRIELQIVWSRDHSVEIGLERRLNRSAKMFDFPGICLTRRFIPFWLHHWSISHTSMYRDGELVPPFLFRYETTEELSVAIITVELQTYWWHCFRASNLAFISKTLIWRTDWSGVQAPWNSSPSGSRWAPNPERLVSVKRLCVGRDGFSVTPEIKCPLLSHHSKCFLIGALRRMGYSMGSTWGFHCANKAIWSGRTCSLPNTTNWAAALSFPRRDRKTLAESCFCFLNYSNSSRMPFTLSNGTRTMFLCVRNSIPMNAKFWRNQIWLFFVDYQS